MHRYDVDFLAGSESAPFFLATGIPVYDFVPATLLPLKTLLRFAPPVLFCALSHATLLITVANVPSSTKFNMAEYDLTAKLAKSMDRHLVFPLLEWLSAKELYPEDQIQQGKLDLLNKTNMLDYAMEIYTQLNNTDPPQDLKVRRTEVVQNLRKLQVSTTPATSWQSAISSSLHQLSNLQWFDWFLG